MFRATLVLALAGPLLSAVRPTVATQSEEEAQPRTQTQATETQLANLESEVAGLDVEVASRERAAGHPLDPALSDRARALHDDVTYLKVKSRRHKEAGGEGTGLDAAEVLSAREAIAKLRDDIRLATPGPSDEAPGEPESDAGALEELPTDTVFSARLLDSLDSETAEVGDRFEAVTTLPVTADGKTLIPEGASVFGAVESVDRAGRTHRTAKLLLAFDRIEFAGESHVITATVVGASEDLETGIGKEKKKVGIGAGVGGVLGAVLGGGTGAIAGAILGGTGAIFGTEGKNVELPRGTMLQLRLDRPLSVRPRSK